MDQRLATRKGNVDMTTILFVTIAVLFVIIIFVLLVKFYFAITTAGASIAQ